MTNHASMRPTQNHDRRCDEVSLDEVERIVTQRKIVIDASTDRTSEFLSELLATHPDKKTVILENPYRPGAADCRVRGISAATNDLILFCDDDLFLQPGYDEPSLR
jgi:GT2 family glycosyltransferase